VIVDSKGEGMILTDMAANQTMTEEFISQPSVSLSIDNANTIVVIDPPLDVASALLTRAKEHNAKTITTTIWSPALLTRYGLATLQACMKDNVDYLILNEHEASYLASMEWNTDAVAACRNLAKNLPRCKVVVTLGPRGSIFCHPGEEEAGEKELTLLTVPTMDLASCGLKIVSTVGAGDTFVGTFAALKTKGLDDLEALFTANIAAALKTTKEETRGSPTFDEVSYYRNTRHSRSLFSSIGKKQIR
jgi:ribokinase